MRRAIFTLLAGTALIAMTGCSHDRGVVPGTCAQAPATCRSCNPTPGPYARGCGPAQAYQDPGPATGAVAYPYYTLRGPRDFLARNPRSIGP